MDRIKSNKVLYFICIEAEQKDPFHFKVIGVAETFKAASAICEELQKKTIVIHAHFITIFEKQNAKQ